VAADPDPAMVEVGRQQVPGVDWVVADALAVAPETDLDLIYGAQVWHWIPRRADAALAAKLSPDGVMAWIWNLPDADEAERLLGDLYSRLLPDSEAVSERRRQRRDSQSWSDRLAEVTGRVQVFEHSWSRLMTTEQYTGMSGTFSDHVTLPHQRRRALMEALAERINSLGGTIEVSYMTRVVLGFRCE
jgi:trans-aconitate methyltransferase